MRKGVSYIIALVLIAGALFLLYSSGPRFTGFAVFKGGELISPQNDTNYANATQLVNISILEEGTKVWYNWNETNITYREPRYAEFNEGLNILTIWINDSEGNVSSIPVTFTIDTTGPEEEFSIIIHSPEEDKEYNTTEIALNVSANKENVDTWLYNLNNEGNTSFTQNRTITATEGENTLIVYANNTKGNVTNASVSFNVVICIPNWECDKWSPESCPSSEIQTRNCKDLNNCRIDTDKPGEEKSCTYVEKPKPLFDVSEILPLSVNPGSSQESSLIIKNTGEILLSGCISKLMGGEFDSWISFSEETININPSQEHAFSFIVTVPEETAEDSYSLKIATLCPGTILVPHDFVVNVVEKKLEFDLIGADRTRSDRVRVIYSLEELSGNDQEIVFTFSLVDANDVEVGRVEVNQSIDANSSDEFRTNININESLLPINETTNETVESSELILNVNFNSEIYSSSVMEKITLGAPIGGFAIFAGVGAGEAVIFVVVLFVLVFIFIFARRMRKKGKTLKDVFKKASEQRPQ